ncbi:MAG: hypothetical protein DME89_10685 [Verrucomicrobia bacterium]|nr:MAG: hypothetical protein DME89_10685 [Verrucomicrobiota bacterium]
MNALFNRKRSTNAITFSSAARKSVMLVNCQFASLGCGIRCSAWAASPFSLQRETSESSPPASGRRATYGWAGDRIPLHKKSAGKKRALRPKISANADCVFPAFHR